MSQTYTQMRESVLAHSVLLGKMLNSATLRIILLGIFIVNKSVREYF